MNEVEYESASQHNDQLKHNESVICC